MHSPLPLAFDILLHALSLIALCAIGGGFAFAPLALATRAAAPLRTASDPLRRNVLWVCLALAAVAFAGAFIRQAIPMDAGDLLRSRAAAMFAVRVLLLSALAVLLRRRRHESAPALLSCAALMLTQSLLSRSAEGPEWLLPTLADWIHLSGAAMWLGGVMMLTLVAPLALAGRLFKELGEAIRRFSPIATACVLVVALTGIVQAAGFVGSFDALVNTAYGRALLVKLALFGVLIGFGAFHQYVISPRLNAWRASADSLEEATRRFRVSILAEVGVSVLILIAAAAMTVLPPARDIGPASSLDP